ncbi:MAG: zinc ribbon domain-containing protein [Elusimicrobia bacterium]|nr:zinc ribbon domain-containing protein [Elusimicrobiota bacterium]
MAETVYEMQWDCEYCGRKKLLGLSHRFCPACGAPQNPAKRYFPAEADKILAKDHEYSGADKTCPHCKNPVSAKMKFCAQCGGPMEGAGQVKLVGEAPAPAAPEPAKGGRLWWKLVLGCFLAGAALFIFLHSYTRAVPLRVAGHSWSREIEVERFQAVSDSSWCDDKPFDAYSVSRRREVRSHRQVADGETCKTVKKDRGDGTFSESQECHTKYRSEPVYDSKCSYLVDRWRRARAEKKEGAALEPEPAWPEPSIRSGSCLGCERLGARQETYTVRFTAAGKDYSCDFSQDKWKGFPVGSKWSGAVRLIGGLVCDSLK